jgi:5'-nucleotidase
VLVTNDDGVAAPGIDALTEALETLDGVQAVVVAPAQNQSGTGGKTSPTPPTAQPAQTASGHAATAVNGFPADAVLYGLDTVLYTPPDLVVSGINRGQNVGPLMDVSGTVGAARAAAQRGIPAIAVSQALTDPMDYDAGVAAVLDWIRSHRDDLAGATAGGVVNINAPTCPDDAVRGTADVPAATDFAGRDPLGAIDCAGTGTNPVDDVDALLHGFVAVSPVAAAPAGAG